MNNETKTIIDISYSVSLVITSKIRPDLKNTKKIGFYEGHGDSSIVETFPSRHSFEPKITDISTQYTFVSPSDII